MRIFHSERFSIPLPAGHRFPMGKYGRLRARVEQSFPAGQINLLEAPAAGRADLERVHDSDYVGRVLEGRLTSAEQRLIGLPWSPALVARSLRSVGATLAAAGAALEDGVAVSLAGGTHHAGTARGAGFCVFNDLAVASTVRHAMSPGARVLIMDCDVHQGDGTAELLRDEAGVFTVSMHAARNYPHHKIHGHCELALPDGAGDNDYLGLMPRLLDHAIRVARPALAFYLAGADVYAGDRLGRLSLSRRGIAARDRLVFERMRDAGIPVATVMGGGYADPVDDIVDIHAATVAEAHASWHCWQPPERSAGERGGPDLQS